MNGGREPKPRSDRMRWLWVLAMVSAGLLLARLVVVSTQTRAIGIGQEMMADDFGFTIVAVDHPDKIVAADKTSEPTGEYWVVDLQVANHAKRVGFRFDPSTVVLEDQMGNRYLIDPSAQEAIDLFGAATNTLAAGEVVRRKIVFDLPNDVREPRIRIVFGGRIGEVLDYLLYGNRWFEVPEMEIPPL